MARYSRSYVAYYSYRCISLGASRRHLLCGGEDGTQTAAGRARALRSYRHCDESRVAIPFDPARS